MFWTDFVRYQVIRLCVPLLYSDYFVTDVVKSYTIIIYSTPLSPSRFASSLRFASLRFSAPLLMLFLIYCAPRVSRGTPGVLWSNRLNLSANLYDPLHMHTQLVDRWSRCHEQLPTL